MFISYWSLIASVTFMIWKRVARILKNWNAISKRFSFLREKLENKAEAWRTEGNSSLVPKYYSPINCLCCMFLLFNSLLVLRFNLFFFFVCCFMCLFVPVTTTEDCCSVEYHCADTIKPSALLWCIKNTLTQTCTSLIHSFQSSTQGGIMKTLIGEQHLE